MIIYPHAIIRVTDDVRVEHRAGLTYRAEFTPTAYVFHFGEYAKMYMGPWA